MLIAERRTTLIAEYPLIMYDGFWLILDVGGEFGFHTRNPAISRSKRAGFLHSPPTSLLGKQACSFDRYDLSKVFF
jgi:hypothetical protein